METERGRTIDFSSSAIQDEEERRGKETTAEGGNTGHLPRSHFTVSSKTFIVYPRVQDFVLKFPLLGNFYLRKIAHMPI